jgi:hypothetical protein
LALGIVAPLYQFARLDAEGLGEFAYRGHVRLGFVSLGPGDGGLGKTGAFS